jgi:hypothetical protein
MISKTVKGGATVVLCVDVHLLVLQRLYVKRDAVSVSLRLCDCILCCIGKELYVKGGGGVTVA